MHQHYRLYQTICTSLEGPTPTGGYLADMFRLITNMVILEFY